MPSILLFILFLRKKKDLFFKSSISLLLKPTFLNHLVFWMAALSHTHPPSPLSGPAVPHIPTHRLFLIQTLGKFFLPPQTWVRHGQVSGSSYCGGVYKPRESPLTRLPTTSNMFEDKLLFSLGVPRFPLFVTYSNKASSVSRCGCSYHHCLDLFPNVMMRQFKVLSLKSMQNSQNFRTKMKHENVLQGYTHWSIKVL